MERSSWPCASLHMHLRSSIFSPIKILFKCVIQTSESCHEIKVHLSRFWSMLLSTQAPVKIPLVLVHRELSVAKLSMYHLSEE